MTWQDSSAPRAPDEMKIGFGGGGDADDERPLLEVFGSWVGNGKVLYVPIAADPPYEPLLEWAIGALRPVGITNIEMATSPEQLAGALTRSGAVFVGGGNTYSLLHALRRSRADDVLRRFAESGRPAYGGSAGAILFGRDIGTARHADPNEVGLTDTTGLDLAFGYAIWCHYIPEDDSRIRDFVSESRHAVIALSERSGLARTGETIHVIGEPARLFGSDSSRILKSGDSVPAIEDVDAE